MINGKLQGLCTTCIHASICGLGKNSHSPVIYCEEFEYRFPPMSMKAEITANTPKKARDQLTEKRADHSFKGLCINCENRETCMLPKSESGVWHCEEYR